MKVILFFVLYMIQTQTILNVVDNSQAKFARCIKVFKGKYAKVGDIILVSLREIRPSSSSVPQKTPVKKGQVCRALVLRTSSRWARKNGNYVKFEENAVLLLNAKNEPLATRAFGPTIQELREAKNVKVISLLSYLV
jgi:large subunit ribosomal protein L14